MTENGAKTMTTVERRKRVAELHLQGLTPSGIGGELDITPQLAGRDLAWVRRNQPQWLGPQSPEPNDDTIVSSTVADAPNEDGSAVEGPKPTVTAQSGENSPETPRRAVFAPAPRVVRSDGLLDPPKPPVTGPVDDGQKVEKEPAEKPHARSAMQYAVDTALGKFPDDDDNDDVSVDEWAEEHFDRIPYDSKEKFLELDDDEKWNYVNRTRRTDRAWISIFGVLLIIVIVLVLMFQ